MPISSAPRSLALFVDFLDLTEFPNQFAGFRSTERERTHGRRGAGRGLGSIFRELCGHAFAIPFEFRPVAMAPCRFHFHVIRGFV